GSTTNGGYAIAPDTNAFTTAKVLDFYWAGAKYALPSSWSFTGAYYHVDQNSYVADNVACTAGGASASPCAGSFDQGFFLVDYEFNKHFDVYAGVTYARVDNGLAANYQGTVNATSGNPLTALFIICASQIRHRYLKIRSARARAISIAISTMTRTSKRWLVR